LLTSLFNGAGIQQILLEILYRVPAVIVALSFHEWAHAYAAFKLGDPTARNFGRMTLNPFAHIDPIGFVLMLLVRFGWAKPVPVNIRNFKKPRRDDIIVSLAGVTVNLVLAFLSLGVLGLLLHFGIYNDIAWNIVMNFCFINLGLMVFNLIPIPPLDGYHVLQNALMRRTSVKFFMTLERYGSIILIVLLVSGALTSIMSWAVNGILSGMLWLYHLVGLF